MSEPNQTEPNHKPSDAAKFLQEATKAANYWTGYNNAREAAEELGDNTQSPEHNVNR